MIIFEAIGLFIVVLVGIVLLALLCSCFICGSDIDEKSMEISFFYMIVVLLFIASILFVQFKHYPEKFGYTAIEEVEEVEVTE